MNWRFWCGIVFVSASVASAFTVAYTIFAAGLAGGSVVVNINHYGEGWLDYIFAVVALVGGGYVAVDFVMFLHVRENSIQRHNIKSKRIQYNNDDFRRFTWCNGTSCFLFLWRKQGHRRTY